MPDSKEVLALVDRAWRAHAETALRMKMRRLLINQQNAVAGDNALGTTLPAPFNRTSLAIKAMIGEPSKAAQHYASRIAANRPDIEVIPLTAKRDISQTVSRQAGEQERLDAQLWSENGGRDAQWKMGWAMSVTAVGYYLTLPRDAAFGLPDRVYHQDKTDADIAALIRDGVVTKAKMPHPKTGQLVYAEKGDVWAARRKDKMRAQAGTSLFTLEAFPRDMVIREKDVDGIRWAAVIEEIPSTALRPGSPLAISAARADAVPEDDVGLYGLMRGEKNEIIGGIARGGPVNSDRANAADLFTMIRYFDREEQVICVAARGSVEGGREVYRGKHGCTINGVASCPVEEVPFMLTDVDVPGQEFSTPLQQVFGYVPQINSIMTILSNGAYFNGIPRWVIELQNGTTLRDEDGEPKTITQSDLVPGMSPQEATAWPGTVKQLLIDTKSLEALLAIYFERLEASMPPAVAQGDAGSSGPDTAWGTRQLIQQAQQNLMQPVDNHAQAVKRILQRWHGWLRDLDMPVYFFAAPGHRKDRRSLRGLIEFDPADITDSIAVTQSLDTPAEATVLLQQGIELRQGGYIDDYEFYDRYAREQDARQAIVRKYVQQVVDHVMGGVPAPPGSVIQMVADGVRGQLHYALLAQSANYSLNNARMQAAQANQQMALTTAAGFGAPGGAPSSNVTAPAGIVQPGQGMAPTLEGQLGTGAPGGQAAPSMAGVPGG